MPGGPEFFLSVTRWRVGSLEADPMVVFQMNEEKPYSMSVDNVTKFCADLLDETKILRRHPIPRRQRSMGLSMLGFRASSPFSRAAKRQFRAI